MADERDPREPLRPSEQAEGQEQPGRGPDWGLWWDARHPVEGGTGTVSSGYPQPGHYAIADSLEHAQDLINRGHVPLVVPGDHRYIDPASFDIRKLVALQQEQYAAPGQYNPLGSLEAPQWRLPLFISAGGQLMLNPEHPQVHIMEMVRQLQLLNSLRPFRPGGD